MVPVSRPQKTPDGAGNEGLGWTNNPIQNDYPPNRAPFLRTTYADAERPGDWPYQERVIGWMETPILRQGSRAYEPASRFLTLPAHGLFCEERNHCDPGYIDPEGKSFCTRADRHCWWQWSVEFAQCPATCATSAFTVSTTAREPLGANPYPVQCQSTLPTNAIIVDNQPGRVNLKGCGAANWTSQGAFEVRYGRNSAGDPLGEIDWHQLGTGLGGHVWFTKNRVTAVDTAHINTGVWTPPNLNGFYEVWAHLPGGGHGAGASAIATYRIFTGDGRYRTATIDQERPNNGWVSLGRHQLLRGGRVELDNFTLGSADKPSTTAGSVNIVYDAVAFVPAYTKPLPLLGVHGYNDSPAQFRRNLVFARGFVPSADGLEYEVVQIGRSDSIEANAQRIIAAAEGLVQSTGAPQVNVLAHSKGGLDARRAMWLRPELFSSLGMLATPNGGSGGADNYCIAVRAGGPPTYGPCDGPEDGIYNLTTGYMTYFNQQVPDHEQHKLYVTAGNCLVGDIICVLADGAAMGQPLFEGCPWLSTEIFGGDLVVCVDSAYAMVQGRADEGKHEAPGPVFGGLLSPYNHLDMRDRPCPTSLLITTMYRSFFSESDSPWLTDPDRGTGCEDLPGPLPSGAGALTSESAGSAPPAIPPMSGFTAQRSTTLALEPDGVVRVDPEGGDQARALLFVPEGLSVEVEATGPGRAEVTRSGATLRVDLWDLDGEVSDLRVRAEAPARIAALTLVPRTDSEPEVRLQPSPDGGVMVSVTLPSGAAAWGRPVVVKARSVDSAGDAVQVTLARADGEGHSFTGWLPSPPAEGAPVDIEVDGDRTRRILSHAPPPPSG